MEKTAELLLDLFAEAANRTVLHPEDWKRLYDFTIHVHLRHLPISSWNVSNHLLARDFSHEAASRLSAEFDRFLELLSRYDMQKPAPVKSL
jgi:hypothetical protein